MCVIVCVYVSVQCECLKINLINVKVSVYYKHVCVSGVFTMCSDRSMEVKNMRKFRKTG